MAAQTLDAFLHPVERDVTCKVTVSKRFRNPDGSLAQITLRTLSEEQHAKVRKAATKKERVGGKVEERFDESAYKNELLKACIVEPNFFTKEACMAYGADPDSILKVMFTTGEYNELVFRTLEHNGLIDDLEESEETMPEIEREVKN